MTKKAIDLLEGDRDGFFLQVEGASIDKQDHAANACGQIGEMIEFDNAIAVAQAYARKHPDTLIIVTADHAHTSQIVAEDSNPTGTTPNNSPTGYSNNLTTADGQTMRVTYGTAGGLARPAAAPRASSTRARWSRPGARARAPGAWRVPTTTPTCSASWPTPWVGAATTSHLRGWGRSTDGPGPLPAATQASPASLPVQCLGRWRPSA